MSGLTIASFFAITKFLTERILLHCRRLFHKIPCLPSFIVVIQCTCFSLGGGGRGGGGNKKERKIPANDIEGLFRGSSSSPREVKLRKRKSRGTGQAGAAQQRRREDWQDKDGERKGREKNGGRGAMKMKEEKAQRAAQNRQDVISGGDKFIGGRWQHIQQDRRSQFQRSNFPVPSPGSGVWNRPGEESPVRSKSSGLSFEAKKNREKDSKFQPHLKSLSRPSPPPSL